MKRKLIAMALCAALAASSAMCTLPAMAESSTEQVLNVYKNNEPATLDRVAPTIDEAGKFILFDASEPLFRIVDGKTTESGCESYEYDEASMT